MRNNYDFEFWLTLTKPGVHRPHRPPPPKATQKQPALGPDERAMKMKISVPRAVFQTPSLSATVQVSEPNTEAVHIDADAASEALKEVLGCDVRVEVIQDED